MVIEQGGANGLRPTKRGPPYLATYPMSEYWSRIWVLMTKGRRYPGTRMNKGHKVHEVEKYEAYHVLLLQNKGANLRPRVPKLREDLGIP